MVVRGNMELQNSRIALTGGAGFLGTHVVRALQDMGCRDVFAPTIDDYDLTHEESVKRLFNDFQADVLIHLAAEVGGIGANQTNPGRFAYSNLVMGALLMEHARLAGVRKFVTLGTVCAYPKLVPVPFKEQTLWDGYPEETNAPYGLAKKMLLVLAQSYRLQYNFNAIYLLPANLYGPGDNFDPGTSHVVPAIIRKCIEARERGIHEIVLWGDGTPTREFLYVEDCAEAILRATEHYDGAEPVNIGTGMEISIADLADLIAELTEFDGCIVWDAKQPNGQPRRSLDTTRAQHWFGFRAKVGMLEGLEKTIDWYRAQQKGRTTNGNLFHSGVQT